MPTALPPEGSLLPETYQFNRGDTRAEIVARMTQAMDDAMAELWPKRAKDLPLATPEEAVILASIVEKETGDCGGAAAGRRRVRQPPAPGHAAAVRSDGHLFPDRR